MPDWRPDWQDEIRARISRHRADGAGESLEIEELAQHLEDRFRELRAAGATESAARASALEELDHSGRLPGLLTTRGNLMGNFIRDTRFAFRTMRLKPGFSLMVIALLAIGVAGNAAIFSIFNGLFLRPLPFADSERLVNVDEAAPKWNLKIVAISERNLFEWQEGNHTFEGLAFYDTGGANLSLGNGDVRRATYAQVTPNLLAVLRLEPALGRVFTAQEASPKGPKAAMISYALWQRQFQSDPHVLGRILKMEADAYTIVGVLPREAIFPEASDIWTPIQADRKSDGRFYLECVGRLKPGVTIAEALADLTRVHKALVTQTKVNASTFPTIVPLRDRYLGDFQDAARILLAGVAVVLLIACVNIAGLMLVRGAARGREIAVRVALGASRGAIVRQLLTESMVLAVIGGITGVALGEVFLRMITRTMPPELPPWLDFRMDWRFLVFCAAMTMLSAALFGLAPALDAARVSPRERLIEGARGSLSRGHRRVLSVLITGEVALALILLVGAGQLLAAFEHVLRVDPGFRPQGVTTFAVWLPDSQYDKPEKVRLFFETYLARLRALPGVESASATNLVPFSGHTGTFYKAVEGRQLGPEEKTPVVLDLVVAPGYSETMGMYFVAGRPFQTGDGERKGHEVVIVNQTFAKFFFPGMDPIGKHIKQAGDTSAALEIVGVIADTKHYGLDQEMRPGVMQPFAQNPRSAMTLVLRTSAAAAPVRDARDVLHTIDPDLPMGRVLTMNERLNQKLWTRRAYSWLFGIFAALAIVLAAAGIYGVTSYAVGERTREIGIRLALGAVPLEILATVLRRGMTLVAIGAALGLAGALAASRFIATLLFGIDPRDPWIYVGVIAGLAAVGLLANLIPARRAASLDPMRTLRSE